MLQHGQQQQHMLGKHIRHRQYCRCRHRSFRCIRQSQSPLQRQHLQYVEITNQQRRVAVPPAAQSPNSPDSDLSDTPEKVNLQPTLNDGVNWYCYTALGLLFLTDFTPIGQWLLSDTAAGSAASRLALLQWGAFVLPSLWWIHSNGWEIKTTLKLQTPAGSQPWIALGLAAGPVLWCLINLAIAIKTGNADAWLTSGTGVSSGGGSSPAALLLGNAAGGWAQLPQLVLTAAISPAVAEELLFRGFLLTALQERLGRIDAIAVSAALFALIHLDPQQFFLYCVLGGAAGAAAVGSGSVGPAILLHIGFNAAAVAAGILLHGPA